MKKTEQQTTFTEKIWNFLGNISHVEYTLFVKDTPEARENVKDDNILKILGDSFFWEEDNSEKYDHFKKYNKSKKNNENRDYLLIKETGWR